MVELFSPSIKWDLAAKRPSQKPLIQMWTNASGDFRIRGYYLSSKELLGPDQVYFQRFLLQLRPKHINVKETRAVLFIFWRWLHVLTGKYILLYGNNFIVSQGLKHLLIRGPSMISMPNITMLMALHDIIISSVWILNKENTLADILYRILWQKIANMYL